MVETANSIVIANPAHTAVHPPANRQASRNSTTRQEPIVQKVTAAPCPGHDVSVQDRPFRRDPSWYVPRLPKRSRPRLFTIAHGSRGLKSRALVLQSADRRALDCALLVAIRHRAWLSCASRCEQHRPFHRHRFSSGALSLTRQATSATQRPPSLPSTRPGRPGRMVRYNVARELLPT